MPLPPPTYNDDVHQKERHDCGGGGIFIAVKVDIPSNMIDNLSTDPEDESLWVSVLVSINKELFSCVFYKQPLAPATRIDPLSQVLFKVFYGNKRSRPHPNIVIAGDFDCGDIN